MSRYWDDEFGGDFQNQLWFFRANVDRALKGARGRKVLRDLREALEALPEHRLIDRSLCNVNLPHRIADLPGWAARDARQQAERTGEGVCAIGALLWHRKVKSGMDPAEAFDTLPTLPDTDYSLQDTADLAVREAGVAFPLAWELAYYNDETFGKCTPEERWEKFVAWIDQQLAGPEAVQGRAS